RRGIAALDAPLDAYAGGGSKKSIQSGDTSPHSKARPNLVHLPRMTVMGRISITCSGCGQLLSLGSDDPRAEVECLWCGARTRVEAPKASSAAVRAEPSPLRPRPPEPPPREQTARVAPAQPVDEAIASTPLPAPPPRRGGRRGLRLRGPSGAPLPGLRASRGGGGGRVPLVRFR